MNLIFSDATKRPENKKDARIIAVLSDHADLRHFVQNAVFTVHGRSEELNQDKYLNTCLMRVTIPASQKPYMKGMLDSLGISRAYLYPDLENLAKEISGNLYSSRSEPFQINE